MKKIKLFTLFSSLMLVLSLAACGGKTSESGKLPDPDIQNPDKPGGDLKPDENGFIDYYNNSNIRLNRDYAGKNFFENGIAKVTVLQYIDGDTTHFKEEGRTQPVKIRYYGIDTPESTGEVEEWGKPASNFTKETLKKSKTIVVTNTVDHDAVPKPDSTGSRYVGLVWISEKENAPYNELKLLNLAIVQNGFSSNKGLADYPALKDTFADAEAQAREFKLNMYSGEKDPTFNYGDYENTSIFAIADDYKRVVKGEIEKSSFANKKVRVQGVVAGYTNKILYLQAKTEDKVNGGYRYAGINIFHMSPIGSKYSKVNTRLEVSALCSDSEEFGFQLTAVYNGFKPIGDDKNNVVVLSKPSETIEMGLEAHEFIEDASNLDRNFDFVNSCVEVTNTFKVTGARNPIDENKNGGRLYLEDINTNRRPPMGCFLSIAFDPTPDNLDDFETWYKAEDFIGCTIKLKGIYTIRKTQRGDYEFSISPRNSRDITLIERAPGK